MTLDLDHTLVILAVTLVWVVLWIITVLSIVHNPVLGRTGRGVWIVVAVLFPFLGPLAWLIFHPVDPNPPQTN